MYELSKFDNVDEYIESIRTNSQGTPFEGLADVLEEHRDIIGYYFKHSDEVTPNFIGTKESLFREGVDIDGEKLAKLLEKEDGFTASDSYMYVIDLNGFLVDVARNKTDTWDEFVSYLLEARDILPDNRDKAKEIFNEIQEDSRENLIAQLEAMIQFYEELGAKSAIPQIEHEKARVEQMSKKEVYITAKEKEIENSRDMFNLVSWRPENQAEEGDYIVYEAHVENNRDFEDLDVEVTPNTVYKIIMKVIGTANMQMGDETVLQYKVQPIAFDNEMVEVWPDHFLMNDECFLSPQDQEEIAVYEDSPLGSIDMKVLDSPNANHNFAFNGGHGDI